MDLNVNVDNETIQNPSSSDESYEKSEYYNEEYMCLLCAFYAITLTERKDVLDFKMSVSNKSFGNFKNIVLQIHFGDMQEQTYVFKTNSLEEPENLFVETLDLDYYLDLLEALKESRSNSTTNIQTDPVIVIFTNNTYIQDHSKKSSIRSSKDKNIKAKVDKTELINVPEILADTHNTQDPHIFRITIKNETTKSKRRIYLSSSRCSLITIEEKVRRILHKLLRVDYDVYYDFKNFIQQFQLSNFFLCKDDVLAKLIELIVHRWIVDTSDEKCNLLTKKLVEGVKSFDITVVHDPLEKIEENIWEQVDIEEKQLKEVATKYGIPNVKRMRNRMLWYIGVVPLVIKINTGNKAIVQSAIDMLKHISHRNKRLLLLSQGIKDIDISSDVKVFSTLADLKEENIYNDIINEFYVDVHNYLQNGRQSMSLKDLIGDKPDLIDTKMLFELTQRPKQQELLQMKESALKINFDKLNVLHVSDERNKKELCRKSSYNLSKNYLPIYVFLKDNWDFNQHDEKLLKHFVDAERDNLSSKFTFILLKNQQICFFFDIDEVESEDIDNVLNFIKQIYFKGFKVCIVTCTNLQFIENHQTFEVISSEKGPSPEELTGRKSLGTVDSNSGRETMSNNGSVTSYSESAKDFPTTKQHEDKEASVFKLENKDVYQEKTEKRGTSEKLFKPKAGSQSNGDYYQDLVTANIVLKLATNKTFKNFHVSSKDNDFKQFGDVVMDTETLDGDKKKVAMQVIYFATEIFLPWHTLGFEYIKTSFERGSRGKMNIKNYVELYSEEKSCDKLILFTNGKFKNEDQCVLLPLDLSGGSKYFLRVNILLVDKPDEIINTFGGICFKFRIITETNDIDTEEKRLIVKKYEVFFSKFRLYTNQQNYINLQSTLSQEFQHIFDCRKTDFFQYIDFIRNWEVIDRKKNKLDKYIIGNLVTLMLLKIKPIYHMGHVNKKKKLLQKCISKYNITFADYFDYNNLQQIWSDIDFVKTEEEKKQIVRYIKTYQLIKINVNTLDELDGKQRCKLLWLLEKCPLIVFETGSLRKILQIFGPKNIVVLTHLTYQHQRKYEELTYFSIFRYLTDLRSEAHLYNRILQTFEVSIQGKKPVTLECLRKLDSKFEDVITVGRLMEMTNKPLLIGRKSEKLPPSYIERKISGYIVDRKFLEVCNKKILIVISHLQNFPEFKSKLENVAKKYIYFAYNKLGQEDIKKIMAKLQTYTGYIHLRLTKEGILKHVRHENLTENLTVFLKKQYEAESEIYSSELDDNILLICADPGSGKTTLTKNLKNNLNLKYWTIIIQATDIPTTFHLMNTGKTDSFIKIISKQSEFDRQILDIFKANRAIMFVWDAIDELSDTYLDKVIWMIDQLSKEGFPHCVTIRNCLVERLEAHFGVFARTIQPLNSEQQEIYITKRLKCKYPKSIKEIVTAVKDFHHEEILRVPRQLNMITTLFYENSQKCLDFLNSTFSVVHLYQYFFEESCKIYVRDKLKISDSNDKVINILKRNYEKELGMCAVQNLFKKKYKFNIEFEIIKNEIFFLGFITQISEEKVIFIHPSFEDFFAALHFYKKPGIISSLKDVIFDPVYGGVRFMFDILMAEDNPLHLAVLHQKMSNIHDNINHVQKKDKGGRTPLHLICSLGYKYVIPADYFVNIENTSEENHECDNYNSKYYDDNDDEFYRSDLHKKSDNYRQIICFLLKYFSCDEKDVLFGMDALTYADKSRSILALMYIAETKNQKLSVFDKFRKSSTFLYYTIKFDQSLMLQMYDIPLVKTRKAGNSLLHLAVKFSAKICTEKLLWKPHHKRTIDYPNKQQLLPIHTACRHGNVNVLEMLLLPWRRPIGIYRNLLFNMGFVEDENRFVNALTYRMDSPLHIACYYGHLVAVHFLTERNANVNLRNNDGETPIQVATKKGHIKVVEYFIDKYKEMLDYTDNTECTLLHLACEHGHHDIVEFLIIRGVNVNSQNKKGNTPLHTVLEKRSPKKTVDFLLKAGASVDVANFAGQTPAHLLASGNP